MSGVYHFVYERYVTRTKRILAISGPLKETLCATATLTTVTTMKAMCITLTTFLR